MIARNGDAATTVTPGRPHTKTVDSLRVWAYLVVSSEEQAATIGDQRQWAEQVALEHGWTIAKTFQSVSTGKAGVRKLLDELIAELRATPKASRPSRVLMIRIDRLGRGLAIDVIAALAELYSLGTRIFTREDGEVRIERASDAITPMLRAITGALENEARRDKSRAVVERKKRDGEQWGTKRAYGIRLVDGRDVAREPQAQAVREAFAMRVKGAGYYAISTRLNAIAPPHVDAKGNERRVHWYTDRVYIMLKNRVYRGLVVDEAVWDAAQEVRNPDFRERGRTKWPWPLSGTLRCWCGRYLLGKGRTYRGRPVRYYACVQSREHTGRYNRADKLEAAFVDLLSHLSANPQALLAYSRRPTLSATQQLAARGHLVSVGRELESIEQRRVKTWELHDRGLVRDEDVQERLETLRREKEAAEGRRGALEAELAAAAHSATTVRDAQQLLRDAAATWQAASKDDQRLIARRVAAKLGGLYVDDAGQLRGGAPPKLSAV